jgi:Domain of unknown function (DUF5658)
MNPPNHKRSESAPGPGSDSQCPRAAAPASSWGRTVLHILKNRIRRECAVRHSPRLFFLCLSLPIFTLIDGILTLELIDLDCTEINPIMDYLLSIGPMSFLVSKFLLTTAGLPVLLMFKKHRLFCTKFRVAYLVPVIAVAYVNLIFYQLLLFLQLGYFS